jgi:ABC-type molybdate transport system permease subunit
MHAKGMLSFTVTVLLCLPSLVAGAALLVNLLLYRNIEQWTQISSALIALGIFFGNSAALLAAVVCAIAALRRRVSVKLKYAHLVVLAFLCRRTGLRP